MTFDIQQATDNYINSLGADALAKAEAYTSGSHWILLWGFIISSLIAWLFVRLQILERVDSRFQNLGVWKRSLLISCTYLLLSSLLTLPWSIYEEWWREVFYEKSSQSFFDFLSQGVTSLLISVVGGGLFVSGIYFFIRKVGKYWWAWSSLLAAFSISAMMLLGPIWIEPLFNQYKPLPPGEVKEALTVLANQANIDPERIFVYDGSRQSNKFTANVTGIGSSARIAISDVALNSASLDEVKAVTAHEIGHYVLGHVWNLIGTATMLSLVFFYATSLIFPLVARWMGTQVTIDDPRGIPILLVCISLMSLLTQPINNFMIRKGETEADLYSYQAVNLPDAMATALVKTAEYRYPRPTPLQEFVFYSHPSVEKRVKAAMEWKSKNP